MSSGANFTPGAAVTVTYMSGLRARKRASTCCVASPSLQTGRSAVAARSLMDGGRVREGHTVVATESSAANGTTSFTFIR